MVQTRHFSLFRATFSLFARRTPFFFFACFFFFRRIPVQSMYGCRQRRTLQRFGRIRVGLRCSQRSALRRKQPLERMQPIKRAPIAAPFLHGDNTSIRQNLTHPPDGRSVEFRAALQYGERYCEFVAPAAAVSREHQGIPQYDSIGRQLFGFEPLVEEFYLREVVHCRPNLPNTRCNSLRRGSAGRATSPICTSRSILGIRIPPFAWTFRMPYRRQSRSSCRSDLPIRSAAS